MDIKVSWAGEALFIGESTTGHKVLMDGPSEGGGHDLGPRPMEMLLLGTGSCSCYDVLSILKKSRQDVTAARVELSGERAETAPRVFKKINLHFVVTGNDVSEKHVERAVKLSAEKYCSVALMLEGTVEITHSFEVLAA